MADDERRDASADHADGQIAAWLRVEPLDDVTRRRLVATALDEVESDVPANAPADAPGARSSRAWRWLAAAAVVVALVVGALALFVVDHGDDQPQASREDRAAVTPKSAAAPREVGDFGDLDQPGNLAALRAALTNPAAAPSSPRAAPQGAGDASTSQESSDATSRSFSQCAARLLADHTVVAEGTGTIDGRRATVVLTETADGSRSFDAVLQDPCELRHLR